MDDINYIWVCPQCNKRQYTEMELCPDCCLKLKKQLFTPETQFPIQKDKDYIKPDRKPDENRAPDINELIKVLLAILLFVVLYYLVFGCEMRITFGM